MKETMETLLSLVCMYEAITFFSDTGVHVM